MVPVISLYGQIEVPNLHGKPRPSNWVHRFELRGVWQSDMEVNGCAF